MDTLDRKTINMLRGADAITFRWGWSGSSYLEASGSFVPRMTVETATPKFVVHGDENSIREACWVFSSARFHQPLVTFLASLRPGDEIRPIFTANNTSPALRGGGVMVDEMAVEIIRPRKGKAPQVFHFLLDTQVYYPRLQAYPNLKRAS